MKSRFKIVSTVATFLLMLGLAITPGFAQLSLDVNKIQTMSVDTGHNQKMGQLTFAGAAETLDRDLLGYAEGEDTTITISYGGLKIANETASALVSCAGAIWSGPTGCSDASMVDHDGDAGETDATDEVVPVRAAFSTDRTKLVLSVHNAGGVAAESMITVNGVRVDTSGKKAGDEIMAHITASQGATDGSVDVGGGDARRVVTVISTVGAAVTVPSVSAASAITCADGGTATITVKEGFASAWEDIASDATSAYRGESTSVAIVVLNVPADVKFKWPKEVGSDVITEGAAKTVRRPAGASMLKLQSAEVGTEAVYTYEEGDGTGVTVGYGHNDTADSFVIGATVQVGAGAVATTKPADVWAFLHPEVGSESARHIELSYKKVPVTDENEDDPNLVPGEFLNLSDCITYLLFPYVTCGSSDDWTTGLAIANTSMDEALFDHVELKKDQTDKGGAISQSGPIYVHAYVKSSKTVDGSSGTVPESSSTMLTSKLAAGDTIAFECGDVIIGDGYLIAEAHFRNAYGMAFAFGNFGGGATFDVAHGYTAMVISDKSGMRTD
jgi:hypothetical protein